MNTIQPLNSKTQIYSKNTIKLINKHISKHQKQQERDSKSVWLQNNHSKINKQASKQIKGAGEQGSRTECMELKQESFHSPCAALLTRSTGASARGLQLWGTTGCHSRWCRNDIRQTHEAAQREERRGHAYVRYQTQRLNISCFCEGNKWKHWCLMGANGTLVICSLSTSRLGPTEHHFSLFLSVWDNFLHFHPTQGDLNVDNKPFLFPPRSEFRKKKR